MQLHQPQQQAPQPQQAPLPTHVWPQMASSMAPTPAQQQPAPLQQPMQQGLQQREGVVEMLQRIQLLQHVKAALLQRLQQVTEETAVLSRRALEAAQGKRSEQGSLSAAAAGWAVAAADRPGEPDSDCTSMSGFNVDEFYAGVLDMGTASAFLDVVNSADQQLPPAAGGLRAP
jgi:hypothetical protein